MCRREEKLGGSLTDCKRFFPALQLGLILLCHVTLSDLALAEKQTCPSFCFVLVLLYQHTTGTLLTHNSMWPQAALTQLMHLEFFFFITLFSPNFFNPHTVLQVQVVSHVLSELFTVIVDVDEARSGPLDMFTFFRRKPEDLHEEKRCHG